MDDPRVAQLMNKDVLSVAPDRPLRDVMSAMREGSYSGAVVCEDDIPIGVISERDAVLVLERVLGGDDLTGQTACDVMAFPPFTVRESETMADVTAVLYERGFRRVPVVDDESRLVGMVDFSDLLDASNRELAQQRDSLEATVEERTRNLRDANAQLEALSMQDGLLGIGNRRAMSRRLAELHELAKRYGNPYSVVLADIDFFKNYNDTYGHPRADEVLRRVATAMQGSLRTCDGLYRYGGEEILAVLPETLTAGAQRAGERLRDAVATLEIPHTGSDHGIVTVSCGVASLESLGATPEEWMEIVAGADAALYRAKEGGRNRICTNGESETPG